MLRLKSDSVPALFTARGEIIPQPEWYDEDAMTVVMAAQGYPGSYPKGSQINNLHAAVADQIHKSFMQAQKPRMEKRLQLVDVCLMSPLKVRIYVPQETRHMLRSKKLTGRKGFTVVILAGAPLQVKSRSNRSYNRNQKGVAAKMI